MQPWRKDQLWAAKPFASAHPWTWTGRICCIPYPWFLTRITIYYDGFMTDRVQKHRYQSPSSEIIRDAFYEYNTLLSDVPEACAWMSGMLQVRQLYQHFLTNALQIWCCLKSSQLRRQATNYLNKRDRNILFLRRGLCQHLPSYRSLSVSLPGQLLAWWTVDPCEPLSTVYLASHLKDPQAGVWAKHGKQGSGEARSHSRCWFLGRIRTGEIGSGFYFSSLAGLTREMEFWTVYKWSAQSFTVKVTCLSKCPAYIGYALHASWLAASHSHKLAPRSRHTLSPWLGTFPLDFPLETWPHMHPHSGHLAHPQLIPS